MTSRTTVYLADVSRSGVFLLGALALIASGCGWWAEATDGSTAPRSVASPEAAVAEATASALAAAATAAPVSPTASPSPAIAAPTPDAASPSSTPTQAAPTLVPPTLVPPTPSATIAATDTPASAKTSTVTPSAAATAAESPVPVAAPGSIGATVKVIGSDRKEVAAANAVVWIPGSPFDASRHKSSDGKISSRDKQFDPRVSVVYQGRSVDFPNYDPINHNVFSSSATATFDLGLYRNGDSKRQDFPNPGVVPVFCNIHPQMNAYVVVVDGGIYGKTDANGAVNLAGVPAGRHPLRVWQEKSRDWSGEVVVSPGQKTELTVVLDASSWRDVAHKRKDGTDYPPPDDDENRY